MSIEDKSRYVNDAVGLLKELIATPRVSRDEAAAADKMEAKMPNAALVVLEGTDHYSFLYKPV